MPLLHNHLTISVVLLLILALPTTAFPATHCEQDEQTYFSCSLKGTNKIVSLCGDSAGDAGNSKPAWLQYRFGVAGKPEMVFPMSRVGSLEKFRGAHHYHGADRITADFLSFNVGDYLYTIESIESDEAVNDTPSFYGVLVEKKDKLLAKLSCSEKPVDHMFEAINAVPEDE